MHNTSRILSLIVLMLVAIACISPVNAGEIYREGVFLASLESNDAQSLPPIVSTTSPTRTIPVGAQRDGAPDSIRFSVMQESAESVTHVVSGFVDSVGEQPMSAGADWESGLSFCQDCPAHADEDWLCRKCNHLNRRIYFSRQGIKKSLYPVIRPYCQPAHGVYDTCWRQIQPNKCSYRYVEPHGGPTLLPVPQQALPSSPVSPEGTPLQKLPPYE